MIVVNESHSPSYHSDDSTTSTVSKNVKRKSTSIIGDVEAQQLQQKRQKVDNSADTHTQKNSDANQAANHQRKKKTSIQNEAEPSKTTQITAEAQQLQPERRNDDNLPSNATPTTLESGFTCSDDDELMESFMKIRKKEKATLKLQLETQKKEHEDEVKQMEQDFSEEIRKSNQIIVEKDREIANYKQIIQNKDREIAKYLDQQKLCHCYECGKDMETFLFCAKECKEVFLR